MDGPEIVTLIGVLTLIRLLFGILANAPKVWENVCKEWAFLRQRLLNAKRALVTSLREMVGEDEMQEDAPSSPKTPFNVFDAVNMGLNQGYPALRHRQNTAAYYYADGVNVSVFLTGQTITPHASHMTPLCISVHN